MNILYLGSDRLYGRVRSQVAGQAWTLHRAADPDHLIDFKGSHSFQAALVSLCEGERAVSAAANTAKTLLDVPVVIGLASSAKANDLGEKRPDGPDIILTECGNDRLTKLQCDAILRFANGAPSEKIVCGEVAFDTSKDVFSVNGSDIHLPRKKHKLLELLFLKRGRTVTKDAVINHLYGWDDAPEPKVVDVFVCQIRRALREAGLKAECIQTVRGRGYRMLEAPVAAAA